MPPRDQGVPAPPQPGQTVLPAEGAPPQQALQEPIRLDSSAGVPSPPSLKDPIDVLAAELGISYIRAKKIYDEGLGIPDLQKMRVEKIAKIVGDLGIATAIKQKIGHIFTEAEMEEISHEVASEVDALISFAPRVGFNMDDMKRAVDYLRTITREKKVRESIEYAERLKGASIEFHKEAIARARHEIEATLTRLEKYKKESQPLVEVLAKIDVALGMNDYASARRAAITGLDTAAGLVTEVECIEKEMHEINEAVSFASSLNLGVDDLKTDATLAEKLTLQGDFVEARKLISKCKRELEQRVSGKMKEAILQGKRKLLEMKIRGEDITQAKGLLDSAKRSLSEGRIGDALSAYIKFRDALPGDMK